jgi:pseudouridine kinase
VQRGRSGRTTGPYPGAVDEPLVVVIGGANVDIKARSLRAVHPATSNPGTIVRTPGGVGRNVAENLARLGSRVALVTAVGDDADGEWLLGETAAAGVDITQAVQTHRVTGTYAAVLDPDGELVVAVSDMVAVDAFEPEHLDPETIAGAHLLVLDGNLPSATMAHALDLAAEHRIKVVVEPVSVAKAQRLSPLLQPERPVYAITPNRDESAVLGDARSLHERGVAVVWERRGARGSMLSGPSVLVELDAPPADVVDVTGAGDAMLAAFCHAVLEGASPEEAARQGHRAAALTVASPHTVVPDLAARMVE